MTLEEEAPAGWSIDPNDYKTCASLSLDISKWDLSNLTPLSSLVSSIQRPPMQNRPVDQSEIDEYNTNVYRKTLEE